MANSSLLNTYHKVPQNIIDEINLKLLKYKNIPSQYKRKAQNIAKNPYLSYQNIKRIKNIFDNRNQVDFDLKAEEREIKLQENKNAYMFLGGSKMESWVNTKLNELRKPIKRSKGVKKNFAGFGNEYRETHKKTFNKAPQQQSIKNTILSELKPQKLMESEESKIDLPISLKFATICLLFNEENKLLLVKRAENDAWMGGKFALVGGTIEENEIPEETILREIKEETNLTVKNPKLCYSTIEGNTFVYVFVAKTKNSDKIKLNDEHTGYVWVNSSEIQKYDTVPNIMDNVKKAYDILINHNNIED